MPLVVDPSPSSPFTRQADYCVYPGLSYLATVLSIKQLIGSSVCEVHLALTGTISNKFRMRPQELANSLEKCSKSSLVIVIECSASVDIHNNRGATVYSSLESTKPTSNGGTKVAQIAPLLRSLQNWPTKPRL